MLVFTRFERTPLLFRSPERIISCRTPSRIKQTFDEMEYLLDEGYYLAGFISYEAGYAFESALAGGGEYSFPLLQMGCYRNPVPAREFLRPVPGVFRLSRLRPSLSFEEYAQDIGRIRAHIARGDVYQITYCLKMKFSFEGTPLALFRRLLTEQPVPYPAYVETGDFTLLSLSPESFVKRNGTLVSTKPMKGTWPRGANPLSDLAARFRLKYDEKNRAENVMITDLLRNDLGRIGRNVRVSRLFEVSSYATLYQMTSSVHAEVEPGLPLRALFGALFPSGSVTGAPKIRAMQVIRGLEREERRIYTGAIGFITPGRDLHFNVPIRTLLLEGDTGEMGGGGGIIWDSTARGEWEEGLLKTKFLRDIAS